MPANGSADQSGSKAPISMAGKSVADVLAKPAVGTRINEINMMDKKWLNLFQKLFSIFHMCYILAFRNYKNGQINGLNNIFVGTTKQKRI